MAGWSAHWRRWARPVTLATLSGVIGWFAFVADRPVPLLDWFDLAIHETGHLVAYPLPELIMFMAGSFAQIAFPLGMAVYFAWGRHDPAAAGFCAAWAGTSAWDVSVYVADAPVQALPLIGGGRHDWAFILGHFDAIDRSTEVAGFIETMGAILVLVGIAAALWPLAARPGSKRTARPPLDGNRPVPVRPARVYEVEPGADPWVDAEAAP